jgi:predicted CopG family antitoxin
MPQKGYKTITVSGNVIEKLIELQSKLSVERKRRVSLNEVIQYLIEGKSV